MATASSASDEVNEMLQWRMVDVVVVVVVEGTA